MKDSCQHVRLVGTLGYGTAGTKAEERAPLNARRCNKRWAGGSQRPPPSERPAPVCTGGHSLAKRKKVPFECPAPLGAPCHRKLRRGRAASWRQARQAASPAGAGGAPPARGLRGEARALPPLALARAWPVAEEECLARRRRAPGVSSRAPKQGGEQPRGLGDADARNSPDDSLLLFRIPVLRPSRRQSLVSQRQFQARKYIFGSGCSRHGWLDAGGNCRSFLRPHPQTVT